MLLKSDVLTLGLSFYSFTRKEQKLQNIYENICVHTYIWFFYIYQWYDGFKPIRTFVLVNFLGTSQGRPDLPQLTCDDATFKMVPLSDKDLKTKYLNVLLSYSASCSLSLKITQERLLIYTVATHKASTDTQVYHISSRGTHICGLLHSN